MVMKIFLDGDNHNRRGIWEYTFLGLLPASEYDKSILVEYTLKMNIGGQ